MRSSDWSSDVCSSDLPAPPAISMEQAYKKEYAFLQAQKRELSERVAQSRSDLDRDRASLQGQINALESRLLSAKSEAESLSNPLARGDEIGSAPRRDSECK